MFDFITYLVVFAAVAQLQLMVISSLVSNCSHAVSTWAIPLDVCLEVDQKGILMGSQLGCETPRGKVVMESTGLYGLTNECKGNLVKGMDPFENSGANCNGNPVVAAKDGDRDTECTYFNVRIFENKEKDGKCVAKHEDAWLRLSYVQNFCFEMATGSAYLWCDKKTHKVFQYNFVDTKCKTVSVATESTVIFKHKKCVAEGYIEVDCDAAFDCFQGQHSLLLTVLLLVFMILAY